MKRPNQAKVLFPELRERNAHQRRMRQIKSRLALFLDERVDFLPPTCPMKRNGSRGVYPLPGFFLIVPKKTGSQCVAPIYHLLPGSPHSLWINSFGQRAD